MSEFASTSTATEDKHAHTLAQVVKKMDQRELLKFLKDRDDIHLNRHEWDGIFNNQHISGRAFLNLTKLDFLSIRLPLGPAVELADFVEELRENHFKTFSSCNILGELLRKYKLDGNSIEAIPLFKLARVTCEIQDSDKHFVNCMTEIMVRLKNYGSLFVDSLEFMRNEYVAAILHAALNIARVDTQKEFSMRSQCEMLGEESIGRVDYAIKDSEYLFRQDLSR
ncbi:unnamed protein product [Rhizophagus irregularis]|uniref:Uncharacterized protein n=1 Tax=Rhizophagus irregularis TaxID=588596 RepID=A0A916DW40_9GLOM|nr:unnamed protein product [Rhizophagus irregularis]